MELSDWRHKPADSYTRFRSGYFVLQLFPDWQNSHNHAIIIGAHGKLENFSTFGVLSLGRAASRRFLTQIGQWSHGRIAKVGTLDDTSKAFPH